MSRAAELSRSFLKAQPVRAARALDQIPAADVAAFFASLGEAEVAEVISRMQPSHAAAVLEASTPEKSASILHQAPAYARALLMRALPEAAQKSIIKAAPRRQAAALSRYLSYDPGTVGAWMEAPSATFAPDTRVGEFPDNAFLPAAQVCDCYAQFLFRLIISKAKIRGKTGF